MARISSVLNNTPNVNAPTPNTQHLTPNIGVIVNKTVSILRRGFWVDFWSLITEHALHAIAQIVALLVLYLVLRAALMRVLDALLKGLLSRESRAGFSEERAARLKTLQGLARSIVSYTLFFLFGVLLLEAVGLDILPLITTASVVGVAIALGSQKLFKDVISGFFLIVDNLFVVGDTVTIGGVTGVAQEIGMRVTRVLDATGRLHLFANGDIGTVVNLSRYPVEDFIEIAFAPTADINIALKTLNDAGQTLFTPEQTETIFKAAPVVLGLSAVTALAYTARVSVVAAPQNLPQAQMDARRVLRDALSAAAIPLA